QFIIENINKIQILYNKFKNSTNWFILSSIGILHSYLYQIIGSFFVDNQFEQKKYLKKAQRWLKKGELLLPEKAHSSLYLFYYLRYTNVLGLMFLGYSGGNLKNVMDDLNICLNLVPLLFPKITCAISIFFIIAINGLGAITRSAPDISRINFARINLDLIELIKNRFPTTDNSKYKILNLIINSYICSSYATLGDLIKDKKEKSRYLQTSSEIFKDVMNETYKKYQKVKNSFIYQARLSNISITGLLLADNSVNKIEKVNYYQTAIDSLLKINKIIGFMLYIVYLFEIGDTYYEIGRLTNDDEIFKKSYTSYTNAINYCKNRGYFNLVGSGYVILAKIEDRLGNFASAAENYKKAVDSFDQAILTLTYTKLGKKIENLRNYMQAWNIIEIAKSYHKKEDHHNAQINYEKASEILKNLREYKFEAPFYAAWAILEIAEDLSKKNKHQEAATKYLEARNNFEKETESLNSFLTKRTSPEDKDRISKLIHVARIRETYCTARYQIETARLESKKGNHLEAAELYNKASSLFENLCQVYAIKQEKDELMAIYYLCKAWENMERADLEKKSSLYAVASELFEKASNFFPESKMKNLSLGNSLYCSALESGSLFDKSTEMEEKIKFYKKIKLCLRESSKNYQSGGFEQDAQWVLATSTFFDGMWNLIQSDTELNLSKKNQYLNLATNYLNNALKIFVEAGYKQRREEILNYLKMIKDEKAILTSALDLIEKPAISTSSIGISAPSCPVEISSSVNIEEMQRTDLQTESEINWQKRIHHIYLFMPNGTCIYDHPFKLEEEIEPQLVAGGLTGISGLIQEITKNKTKIKIVEQEEMTILLEYGKYLNIALITEENLITLRNKLIKLVQEVEDFFQEELESYSGNLTPFLKAGKFIQKIFEN
ncbi:MAG: tetratricopeptide repeat protein, partial [Candidatus Hodarchaeota archaeon]